MGGGINGDLPSSFQGGDSFGHIGETLLQDAVHDGGLVRKRRRWNGRGFGEAGRYISRWNGARIRGRRHGTRAAGSGIKGGAIERSCRQLGYAPKKNSQTHQKDQKRRQKPDVFGEN